MRLIDYLKEKHPELGKRALKRSLERGACTVNGKLERFGSRKINPSKDKIVFHEINHESTDELIIDESQIIYEDDYLLVYNKPAGHPSLATKGHKRANLHDELKKFFQEHRNHKFIEPAHRLDKDTSGLIIFAKDKDTLSKLFDAFKAKEVEKEYEAIAIGSPKIKSGRVVSYLELARQGAGWQKWQSLKSSMRVEKHSAKHSSEKEIEKLFSEEPPSRKAKLAITDFELVKAYDSCSHIKLRPQTGRTHQLRVHLSEMGHPILGDSFYSEKIKVKIFPPRHLLHASKIRFAHPQTNEELSLYAPLPEDFSTLLKS